MAADEPAKPLGVRERQRQLTRELLLEAARRLFAEQGFEATTIEQIADAAGANRTTLYLHFDGKEAVAVAINDAVWERARVQLERLAALPSWSRDQLRAWLEVNAAEWPEHAATLASLRGATVASVGYRDHVEALAELVAGRLAEADGVGRDEARLRGRQLVLLVQGFYRQWLVWGWPEDRAAELDAFADLCAAALDVR